MTVTTDAYHSDTSRITKTMLALYDDSPERYRATYIDKTLAVKEVKTAAKVGSLCHQVILENKKLDEICVEYPPTCFTDTGRIRPVAAKAFELECSPKLAIRPDIIQQVRRRVETVQSSQLGKLLAIENSDTHRETQVDADLWGLPCKCRPDIFFNMPDRIVVPDLKFGAYEPKDFARSAKRYKYYLQQAHYTAILMEVYEKPVQWMFLVGELTEPYRFGQRSYELRSTEIARDYHEALVRRLSKSYEDGSFADNYPEELCLAPWDLASAEDQEDPDENVEVGDE